MLRRRLTVLLEVYLSRKQHEHAAPLSKQLGCPVMESSLLPMPLLCAACEQCATTVVEVLIAKKADVAQQVCVVAHGGDCRLRELDSVDANTLQTPRTIDVMLSISCVSLQ